MNEPRNRIEQLSAERRALLALKHMQLELEALKQERAEPIAIIGMSCRFPGGVNSPEAFWQLLVEGRDAITEVPHERYPVDDFYDPDINAAGKTISRWGGFLDAIDQFDPLFFGISPREANDLDPQQRLLLEVTWEAMERAGVLPEKLPGSQTGVFVGLFNRDYFDLQYEQLIRANAFNVGPYTGTGNGPSFAAGRLSYILGLQGPNMVIDTVCSSSHVAVHLACQSLHNNECTMAFAGAANLILNPFSTIVTSKMRALSPEGRSKTFDASADGFVRGEGCAMVILKRLSRAVADGDPILALIRGSAVTHDGRSNGLTAPNGLSQQAVIRRALSNARITPAQISYIETHGTGTALGDPIEVDALKAVLGQPRPDGRECVLGSVKTNIGHLEACAGMAGLIKTVLCMQHGMLPPLLHLKTLNPHISFEGTPFVLPTTLRAWPEGIERKYAGVSGAGLSGTNAHIVLEEAPVSMSDKALQGDEMPTSYLLPLSARDPEALWQLALVYQSELTLSGKALASASLRDICCTASMRRTHHPCRIAVAGQTHKELVAHLAAFIEKKQLPARSSESMPGPVFMFSGQGTQWIGMGRQLYDLEPVFKAKIDACDSLLRRHVPWSLLEELRADEKHSRLNETEVAQPALFALQVALAALWSSWGIVPGAVIGHSVGEIAAAHVAGVFSLDEAIRIVACRGRLMQSAHGLGKMAAVEIAEVDARGILADYADRLSLAAVNSPTSVVFSGEAEALEEVLAAVEHEGIFSRRLQVDYAFHSVQVEKFRASFVRELQGLKPQVAVIPLVSTVTGQQSSGAEYDAVYWGRNMCQEVRFGPALEELIAQGYRTFLELSPRPALLQSARACLEYHAENGIVLHSLKQGRDDRAEMLATLGVLYAQGYSVHWQQLYAVAEKPYTVVTLPTYQWQRKRYWWASEKMAPTQRPQSSSRQAGEHPLLGKRLRSALKEIVFETCLDAHALSWLNDHQVYGTAVLPASAYVEMILMGASAVLRTESIQLRDLLIHQALILSPERSHLVQLIFQSAPDKTNATVQVFACPEGADDEDQWTLYVSGRVQVEDNPALQVGEDLEIAAIQSRCLESVERQQHYQSMRARGIHYGASFQGVQQIWRRDGEALGSIMLPEHLEAESEEYLFHPALLDACLQVVATSLSNEPDDDDLQSYLPFSIDNVQVYTRPEKSVWCHVQMRSKGTITDTTLVADIQILDQQGQCIVDVQGLHLRLASPKALMLPIQQRVQDWFYEISWEPQKLEMGAESALAPSLTKESTWLIFSDRSGAGVALAQRLQARGESCLLVFAQQESERELAKYISINSSQPQKFQQLFEKHFSAEHACRGIIYLWGLDEREPEQASATDIEASQRMICGSVLHIVQMVAQRPVLNFPRLFIITRGSQAVIDGERSLTIAQAPVWGLGRVIALEHPDFSCTRIDLDHTSDASEEIDMLLQELLSVGNEDQVAFRAYRRYVARLVRSSLAVQGTYQPSDARSNFRVDSTYLITGGCGGLGLVAARWMVELCGVKYLVLVSRSGASLAARSAIRDLEQTGARVVVINTDVSQEQQVAQMLATIQQSMPPLRGIIHAAGVLDDGSLLQQDWARFEKVMAPKVQGSWNLHKLTRDMALDFFVLFSSGASLLGSAGQGNYAAANAFMDAQAHYRRSQGLPAMSINWGAWAGAGMAATSAVERRLAKEGMQLIQVAQGMEIFAHLLQQNPVQIGVLPIDWTRFANSGKASFVAKLLEERPSQAHHLTNSSSEEPYDLLQNLKEASAGDQFHLVQYYVEQAVRQMLALDADFELEPGQDLFEIGMDSLSAIELRNHFHSILNGDEGGTIPANLVFEHPTVEALATYLLSIVHKKVTSQGR